MTASPLFAKLTAAREAEARGQRKAEVTWATAVAPKAMRWLWEDRIPAGALTMLMGEEGLGKTTVTALLAAMVTRGTLPGDNFGTPGRVLFLSAEDDRHTVLVPRLMAADADLSRVGFLDMKVDDQTAGFVIPRDVALLASIAEEKGVQAVVLDPVVAFMDAETDSHRDKDTRVAMGPLADAAARANFAVIGIIHPNKGTGDSERARMSGSMAFRALARATAVFGLDPDDPTGARGANRVLAPSKNNNAPSCANAYRVRIESAQVMSADGESIRTSRAVLGEPCDISPKAVIGAEKQHEKAKQQNDAESLLELLLPAKVADLKQAAEENNIGWRTFERTKRRLGVVSRREGEESVWWWRFPPADQRPAI